MKPHLPSALRRALLACCALSVGFTLSSGIAAADTTLGKTDTITIDYAISSTQAPLDAAGVLTLTGDTKLMLLNMGDITGFSYTLCTGVSGLQTADGELTLTTGNNSAEAYFDTTAPGSSIWADASLQWVSDRLLLVLNNTRVKDSVTITERQTGSVDYQEYKGVSFESITGGTIFGLDDSTMSNNGSVSFSNNSNYQGGAIFADWCTITLSKNGSVSFNANSADDNGGAIDVHNEGELTLSNNGSVTFLENKATADGGAIFGSDDSSITLSGNGSISFSGNISYLDGGAMTGLFGTTIELNNNSSISISENTATRNGGAIHDYESSISLNENGSVSFSKNAAGGNGGAANIESDGLFTLSNNGSASFSENTADLRGGAIFVRDESSLTLSDNGSVSFSDNKANQEGGAIFADWCPITLSINGSVSFSKNTADWSGGAIFVWGESSLTLSDNGSVSFSDNKANQEGGAIFADWCTITLSGNGSVSFSENTADWSGGAIFVWGESSLTLSDNDSISFSENAADHDGGAIFADWCPITLNDNGSVSFSGNKANHVGGAIYVWGESSLTLSDNGSISFSENTADLSGGAIYANWCPITLNDNGSVSFSGNKANQDGGAIYVRDESSLTLSDNDSISFSENKAANGGAIYVWGESSLTLSDNGSVSFSANKANHVGGAIFADWCTITLSGNGSVSFSENTADLSGGAIFGNDSTISLSNNDKVCFEKNVSKDDGSYYRLQSIYSTRGLLVLSAPENGSITFKDSIYAKGEVKLNAAYDHDGDAATAPIAQSGTITFTGEQAEADLKSYLADNNITLSDEALAEAILLSKTSTLNATTTLYDGTLEVKKGAILEVGTTLTVNEGATLAITDNGQLRNSGTLTLNGKTILGSTISNSGTVKLGGTIDVSGITPYETGISVRVSVSGYEGTKSGFLREGDCRIKVVNGGTIEDTGATIDYNGEVMTGVSTLADGIVQVKTQDINYREYLLENTDNATYSRIATASGGQLERISLRGGILNLDSSLDSGVTLKILGDDMLQAIDMWENVVLSKGSLEELSDSRVLIISGKASTVYEITGELGLGAGVSLRYWNGTVRATDSTLSSGGVDTTEWNNTELKGVTTVRQGATLTLGGNVLLCGKISNSGTLNLTGNITVDAENYAPEEAVKEVLDYYIGASALPNTKNSGFESAAWDVTIAEGGVIDGSAATWTVTGIDAAGLRFDSDGTLHAYGKEVGSVFHVAAGDSIIYGSGNAADFTNRKGTEATGISLNGGTLVLNTGLRDNREDYVKSTAASTVEIGSDVELSAAQLDASAADVTLAGAGGYTMESGANTLGEGVSVGADWSGTVNTTGDTSALELDSLGVSGSKVELGSDSHTLADRNQSVAADLNSTGSVSLTGKELTLSGNNTLGSLSVGSLAITGGSTTVSDGLTTDSISGTVSVTGGTLQEATAGSAISTSGNVSLSGVTLGAVLNNSGTLSFAGNMTLDTSLLGASPENENWYSDSNAAGEPGTTVGSGFRTIQDIYTVVTGATAGNTADWQLTDGRDAEYAGGKVLAFQEKDFSTYWVNEGSEVSLDNADDVFTADTTTLALNGGRLVVDTNTDLTLQSHVASAVEIADDSALNASQLKASAADVTLSGGGSYTMESGANTLGEGVSVGADWSGTVNTTGDTSALELDSLGVSGSTVELGSGSHTLADRNQSVAADLNSTGSVSLTGKELTLSGNNTLGSLSVGSLAITGGSTKIASGLTTTGESSVADGASLSIDGASAIGGKITLGTGSTLTLDGTITVNKDSFAPEDAVVDRVGYFIGSSTTPNSTNSGFEAACWDITIAEGGTITDNGADWQLVGDADADFSFESDGTLHAYGSGVGTVFHVTAGDSIIYGSGNEADFTNSKGTEATCISLNGGTLVLNTGLRDNREDYVKSTAASTVEIGSGVELSAAQLDASAADVTLAGAGGYTMESGANTLGSGVSVGADWSGTVNTTGDTSALELDSLGVSGSKVELGSDSHTLADRNQSVAADLNSTGSVSLTGKELTLSGNNTLGSLSVGTLAITGGSTTLSDGLTTTGESSVADGASLSIDGASAIGGKITLGTGSTLTLDGTIKVNKDSFAPEDAVVDRVGYFIGSSTTPNSTNSGFEAACWDITIAEGGTITDNGADWQLEGDADADFSFEADGTLHAYGSDVGSVYHVAAGDSIIYGSGNEADFTNCKGTEATCISLNGGTLVLNTALRDNRVDYVKSTAASTVEIGSGVELSAAQLDASAADVTLAGAGGYTMESDANTLGEGVSVGADWSGTVNTTGGTSALELDSLGVSGSTVELGSDSHTLADRNQSVAADLNSTGSVSLTGKELTLSGNNTLSSLSVGSLAITGGSTKIASGLTTTGESSVADGASLSIDGASAIGGKITLGTGSTLTLDGTITVNKDSFAPEDAVVDRVGYFIGNATTPNSTNSGFEAAYWDITIAEGGTITDNGADWQLVGDADADFSFESDGTLHAYGSGVGSVFHVAAGDSIIYGSGNEDDFMNSKGTEATCISLNGGTLVLNTALRDNREDYVKSTAASTVEIGSGVELSAAQLDASAADVTLAGAGGYTMESGANTLGEGVSVGADWSGTVQTNGSTSALELDTLGVSGSTVELGSDSHTLADRNQSVAADLNSTGSVSLTGKELTLSGNNTLGSLSVGSLVINGGSTAISHGLTTAGESSVADGASLSIDGASAIGGKITLGTDSTLTLDGTIKVNKDSFAPEDAVVDWVGYFIGSSTTPNSTNSGYEAACWDITIAEGGTITDNGADWQLEGDADADFSFESDGTLHAYGSDVGTVFHVAAGDSIIYGSGNEDDFTNSKGTEATCISLNGGTLVLNTALRDNRVDYVKSTAASTVEIGNGIELKAAQLDASAADVTLAGTGGYDLESGSALAGGVKLGSGWSGTVYTGAIAAGTESLDVNHLGNTDSTVQLGKNGDASMNSLTADAVGTVVTPGALSLMSQTSQVRHLTVKGGLTLGSADAAATLIATGALSTQGITLGNIGSTASAAMLLDDTLNLTVADSELLKLTGSTTVLTLGSAYAGTTTLNGEEKVLGSNGKMIYTLVWQTPLTRAATASSLVLQADTNPVYVQNKVGEQVKHYSYNGRAGLRILNAAYAEHNPQQNAAGGALAGLIDTVDAGKMTDEDLAAVAGASTTVLGQALSGDVERQLRAIRNRAAMGNHGTNSVAWEGNGGLVSTSLPSRYFAWVNAEGNRAEQNDDGTAPGYTLNSWGGTVGAGIQVNSNLTMGLALSAMYGDLRSDGPDSLDGDMDTTYLSAFARYESGKWSHAFIGTAGTMEADYKRTVSHATDSYHTYGDTDGSAFGLMYEVSRHFTLGSKGTLSPVFNISYRHAEVAGYRESGVDTALNVGEQSLDTMTLGLGARYAAVVGERAFNRACHVETRALVKYDFGDTQNNIGVGFVNQATHANIESAEMGAFGVELGAGISVPVGKGSIFADGAVELRSDYTNFNATVGYKIPF